MYSSLDCFLHAARIGESFGMVLAEAMLCGCPVVTASRPFKDNSQVEVVGHLKGGVVARSAKSLATALRAFRFDPGIRQQLQSNLRQWVLLTDTMRIAFRRWQFESPSMPWLRLLVRS